MITKVTLFIFTPRLKNVGTENTEIYCVRVIRSVISPVAMAAF